jgi:hypothetical protein
VEKVTPPPSETVGGGAQQPVRPRKKLTVAAEIAAIAAVPIAVIGVLIAAWAWWLPQEPSSQKTFPPPAAKSSGPTAGGSSPASAVRYLTAIEPTAGKSYIELAPGSRSIRVHCATGQSTDRVREVSYPLYGQYRTFRATVRATGPAPQETRIQVEVLADMQPRANVHVFKGKAAPISATFSGQTLTLRLTCESPDGIAELDEARLGN